MAYEIHYAEQLLVRPRIVSASIFDFDAAARPAVTEAAAAAAAAAAAQQKQLLIDSARTLNCARTLNSVPWSPNCSASLLASFALLVLV